MSWISLEVVVLAGDRHLGKIGLAIGHSMHEKANVMESAPCYRSKVRSSSLTIKVIRF